jgi:hypothetical protein
MKTVVASLIVVLGYLFGIALSGTNDAHPYQTAVGVEGKRGEGSYVVNVTPCGETGQDRYIRFSGKFKMESLGKRRCNNGRQYEAVRVTQCGGPNDKNNLICKTLP